MSESYTPTEMAVGTFVLVGVVGIGYLSVSIAGVDLFPAQVTVVNARFASVGELKTGAGVKIAGVRVGEVRTISLDNYAADVELAVNQGVELPSDTIASIRTAGLLGESFVLLRPGGSERNLATGERISQTEPAIDLIDLVVKYALSTDEGDGGGAGDADPLGLDEDDDIGEDTTP